MTLTDDQVRDAAESIALRKLPALSIRQPWAWAILNAGKDVENRTWATNFRGPFLIHAGTGCTRAEYADACEFIGEISEALVPALSELSRGGIVGVAEIVDCVNRSGSEWFVGEWGFVIKNARRLPFTPCAGALGFFYPAISGELGSPTNIPGRAGHFGGLR